MEKPERRTVPAADLKPEAGMFAGPSQGARVVHLHVLSRTVGHSLVLATHFLAGISLCK